AFNLLKKQRTSVVFGNEGTQALLRSGYTVETTFRQLAEEELIKDDQLRMMFACCHPGISEENQITLILKTLCGFSTAEIARAFLQSEDTISKRLYRTKEFFRQQAIRMELPSAGEIGPRIQAVLSAIYLLFNEGYLSTHSEDLIRRDILEEAQLLGQLLAENEHTRQPAVYALLALICFHTARSDSRLSAAGEIILLPQQNRRQWDQGLIGQGVAYLNQASYGDTVSTYHLEAAIAYEHCTAGSFETTNWNNILQYYTWLCQLAPSPITALNKAIVVLQVHGPQAALQALETIPHKKKMEGYYLYYSLLGEIHHRLDDPFTANQHFRRAIQLTRSEAERKMLEGKLQPE
ncbi:MAG: DUF6596 domain-containing protein, partial [Saprospiraceae bacterium]